MHKILKKTLTHQKLFIWINAEKDMEYDDSHENKHGRMIKWNKEKTDEHVQKNGAVKFQKRVPNLFIIFVEFFIN